MKDAMLCAEPYCMRKRRTRNGKPCGKYCTTHDKANWRRNNPMKACFQTLRQNARRRGKPFGITFQYFAEFCYETKYMRGKGRSSKSFTIDCIINELGYVEGNIQKLSKSDNSRKGTKVLIYDYRNPEHTRVA